MPTLIDFEATTAGFATSYSEDGFTLSSELNTSFPGQDKPFWSGKSFSNVTDGGYLLNNYSSDVIVVRNADGKAFGATSIGIDGFNWQAFGAGDSARNGTSAVTFTFTGIRAADNVAFDWTAPATDLVDGFQTLALPAEFAAGLIELRWTVTGGAGWGAFDDLELQVNRAPTVDALSYSLTAGATLQQSFSGHDPDNQALTYEVVGTQPEGVYLDGSTFYVVSDADQSTSQTVTFQYRAFDGSEYSAPATVTVAVGPVPNGPDILGGNRSQALVGTAAGERIYGGNSNDTLSGLGGADTLDGGNGSDLLDGGDGHDRLVGANGSDRLDGAAGHDTLDGGNSADTLTGGAGDDRMTGGNGSDLFVFGPEFGQDVVTDFNSNGDRIQMSPAMFGNISDLLAHAQQVGSSVVITYDADHALTLMNVQLSSLGVGDFLFS